MYGSHDRQARAPSRLIEKTMNNERGSVRYKPENLVCNILVYECEVDLQTFREWRDRLTLTENDLVKRLGKSQYDAELGK